LLLTFRHSHLLYGTLLLLLLLLIVDLLVYLLLELLVYLLLELRFDETLIVEGHFEVLLFSFNSFQHAGKL